MTTSVEPTRECPSCGQTLTSSEKSCLQCGKEITNGTKKPGKAKGTPAKATKVECPYCGELVSKRSKKCPACRTSLPVGFYKVLIRSVDKETSEPKTDLIEQVVQVAGDETNEPPSTNTPVVLEESGPKCRESEAPIEGGMKAMETMVHLDSPPVKEPPETVEGQNQTAELAVPLESIPVKGPDMKIEDRGRAGTTAALVESIPVEESSGAIADAMKTAEPIAPVDSLPVEKPYEVIEDNHKTAEIVAPVDSTPAKESSTTGSVAEVGDSKSCHVCEAIVLKSSQESPACIASIIGTAPHAEQAQPAAEPPKAQPQEESSVSIGETEKKPARLIRKRRLKSARLTTMPVVVPTKDIGGTSGIINIGGQTSERR